MVHIEFKKKAIYLRRQGFSYSEILNQVPVAKSTLSLWLRFVGLSKRNKQKLTEKRLRAATRGGEARKKQRILTIQRIYSETAKDIGNISEREFWLIGVMLYWAEGTKEKEDRPGSGVQFTNSDPRMINIFVGWLLKICKVKKEEIYFDIFIHENSKNNIDKVVDFWVKTTGFSKSHFPHIYFKRNIIKTKRKNTGDLYYGLLKVRVMASSTLSRKIAGWINGVIEYFS